MGPNADIAIALDKIDENLFHPHPLRGSSWPEIHSDRKGSNPLCDNVGIMTICTGRKKVSNSGTHGVCVCKRVSALHNLKSSMFDTAALPYRAIKGQSGKDGNKISTGQVCI